MVHKPLTMLLVAVAFMPTVAVAQQPERNLPRGVRVHSGTRSDGTLDLNQLWSRGRAEGKGPVRFTHSPMRLEDIERITPMGLMVGGHVCPIDHGYFYPKPLKPGQPYFDVYSPTDGFIVMVSHRTQLTGSTEHRREYDDYALHIEHSATVYTFYDLLTSLDPAILRELDASTRDRFTRKQMGPPIQVRIPVKAGQVVGKVGGRSLDMAVIDTSTRLKGFLTPSLYGHYAWRVHVVDPFDYFDQPLRSQLLKLNPRQVDPPFGKIDYDIDGRLVGNWFREGSGGYPGDRRDPRGYWLGHLAFAYHHVDPSVVIVSIGDFDGRPRQFGVWGNGPDPAKVSAADGLVKYDLVYAPFNSNGTPIELGPQMRGVQGVLLVQLVENRKLKVEAFPGKNAASVTGFTAGAKNYER
ncbi:hypothetical protein FJY94_03575 [Candidatus Kaiserbacteria bacterium]|nr:hypothetical protein [Candidatus Kaiserbacteria bacterium]